MVTIFHLSDLHIVKNSNWDDMKDHFFNAIRNLNPDNEKLLIVTGDFHNFKEKDYRQAIEFLDELIKAMGIDRHKDVFVVPGNHDVGSEHAVKQVFSTKRGWKTQKSADKAWKKWYSEQEGIVAWLKGDHSNDEERIAEKVKGRLDAYTPYCAFVRSLEIYPDEEDFLPASVHVRTWQGRLNLLHLNTTLVADDSKKKTDQQLDIITAKSSQIWDGVNTDLPTLALGHNSFYDILLSQQEKLKDVFIKHHVCAYLCGDTHKEEQSPGQQTIILDRGYGSTEGNIPNVVGIKAAPDPTDTYSDFGFYLHEWNKDKAIVTITLCRWLNNDNRPRFKYEHGEGDKYHMPRSRSIPHYENLEASLTLARVFKAATGQSPNQNYIVAWDDSTNQFLVSKPEDASPELMMRYLGLSAELLDRVEVDIGTDISGFVLTNRWDSASMYNTLLSNCSSILESIWSTIKSNISENVQNSLAVSTYYLDKQSFPKTEKDLHGYRGEPVRPQGNRWNTFAAKICPGVEDILKNSAVGSDFFKDCTTIITIERAVDGVTALVLACLFYCLVSAEDENTARWKAKYGKKLRRLIKDKFDYAEPSGGRNDNIVELRHALSVFQSLPFDWTLEKKINEVDKIYSEIYTLHYRDDNSSQHSQSKSL